MNNLRQAAQKALDAWDKWDGGTMDHAISPAIEVLRTALAEPQQEPVAWGYRLPEDGRIIDCITPEEHARYEGEYTVPLYAAPQPRREPLTDAQIESIVDKSTTDEYGYDIWCNGKGVARAVELAHGITGETK
jgi:hypothetical protein